MIEFKIRWPLLTSPRFINMRKVDWESYYDTCGLYRSKRHYCSTVMHRMLEVTL